MHHSSPETLKPLVKDFTLLLQTAAAGEAAFNKHKVIGVFREVLLHTHLTDKAAAPLGNAGCISAVVAELLPPNPHTNADKSFKLFNPKLNFHYHHLASPPSLTWQRHKSGRLFFSCSHLRLGSIIITTPACCLTSGWGHRTSLKSASYSQLHYLWAPVLGLRATADISASASQLQPCFKSIYILSPASISLEGSEACCCGS